MKAVSIVLKPGAKFLLDTHVVETLLKKIDTERIWTQKGEMLILEERSFDCTSSRVNTEWTIIRSRKILKRSSSIRLYTFKEICDLLKSVGFGDLMGYSSLDGNCFEFGSTRLYLVAKKNHRNYLYNIDCEQEG